MIHFIYCTTNIINGKQYIGDHSTNDLNDGYIGSGRPYLLNAIKKYGKENFKKEILEQFETKQEAFDAQEKYIQQYNTLVPNGYNISPKGGMKKGVSCHSEESKQKIKEKHLGQIPWNKNLKYHSKPLSSETKEKMKKAKLGTIPWNKNKTNVYSIETLQKISEKGKLRKTSNETKIKLSNAKSGSNNPIFGQQRSEETKEKIRLKLQNIKISEETRNKHKKRDKCKYCGFETNISNLNRYHNNNCKFKND